VQSQFFRFICLFLLLFQVAVSANSTVVCDHLGTPKELYNAQGECVWQAQHSLWGKLSLVKSKSYNPTQAVIEQNAGSNDYKEDLDFQLPNHSCELRFAGQWFDAESGLHYNYNRYYDPNSGQYLSQDPIGLAGGMRTQGYVADPVHWVDPEGLNGIYKDADYHGKTDNAVKSRAPTNGQAALDNSIQVKPTSPRRVGIDPATKEIVVLDKTITLPNGQDEYHGHVRNFDALHQEQQAALKKAGMVDKKGIPIVCK
jgi:RHS repeat-associated protein